MVGGGVSADLVAGSTGEPWALSTAERALVCRAVRDPGTCRVPVLLGTGQFVSWDDTERMTAGCAGPGADAYLIMPPPGIPADPAHYARLQETAGDTTVWGIKCRRCQRPACRLM